MVELVLFASERDKGEKDPPRKVRNQSPSEKETPRNEGINPREKNLEGLKCSFVGLVQSVRRNALSLNESIQMLYVGTAFSLSHLCFVQYQLAVPRAISVQHLVQIGVRCLVSCLDGCWVRRWAEHLDSFWARRLDYLNVYFNMFFKSQYR